jgi:hypothetical protein
MPYIRWYGKSGELILSYSYVSSQTKISAGPNAPDPLSFDTDPDPRTPTSGFRIQILLFLRWLLRCHKKEIIRLPLNLDIFTSVFKATSY